MEVEKLWKIFNQRLHPLSLFTFGRVTECRFHDTTNHGELDCDFFLTSVSLAMCKVIPITEEFLSTRRKGLLTRKEYNPSGIENIKKLADTSK